MVSPSPDLQRKMNNTENIINAGKSHLVDRLQSKYPRDYLELHVHNNLMTKKPWITPEYKSKIIDSNSGYSLDNSDNKSGYNNLAIRGGDKILIICIDFSDKPYTISTADIYNRFFSISGKSLRNFYVENSYGTYIPEGIVIGWYRAPQTYAYYRDDISGCKWGLGSYPHNTQKLFEDALDLVNNDPNITNLTLSNLDVDGDGRLQRIFLVHSGGEAAYGLDCNEIWASRWGIDPKIIKGKIFSFFATSAEYLDTYHNSQRCGIDSHEHGHALGLPDLYDYSNNTNGVGIWSLMGSGSWGNDYAITPVHLDAWSKYQLEWSTAIINPMGQIAINYANNQIIKCTTLDPKEYFLIECRQKYGFDTSLPGSGLLIWHINENKDQYTDINCHTVSLVQADGLNDLEHKINEGDPFDPYPSIGKNRSFSPSSNPSSSLCSGTYLPIYVTDISDNADIMTINASLSCNNTSCEFMITEI